MVFRLPLVGVVSPATVQLLGVQPMLPALNTPAVHDGWVPLRVWPESQARSQDVPWFRADVSAQVEFRLPLGS